VARDQLIERILDQLQILVAEVDRLTGAAAGHNRLNRTDLRALQILRSGGGLGAGALARALQVTSGATTRVIDGLVRSGHVVREPDRRDRRRVLVRLTPVAERMLEQTFDQLRAEARARLQDYGDQELEALAAFFVDARALILAHAHRLSSSGGSEGSGRP
jgi:DNA-binding MarR family transcriptional regulator